MVTRYQKQVSGPLMDRIDIHVDVPRVDFEKLTSLPKAESSEKIRERVEMARNRQIQRFQDSNLQCNADMGPSEVRDICELDGTGKRLMKSAMMQMNLSARGFHRILKLSRTIADLYDVDRIGTDHLAEALQYRPRTTDQ